MHIHQTMMSSQKQQNQETRNPEFSSKKPRVSDKLYIQTMITTNTLLNLGFYSNSLCQEYSNFYEDDTLWFLFKGNTH
nr:hypothetical protein Itr_chr01CG23140 [Ipomoea trifida]